jgi:hypothetical protein
MRSAALATSLRVEPASVIADTACPSCELSLAMRCSES